MMQHNNTTNTQICTCSRSDTVCKSGFAYHFEAPVVAVIAPPPPPPPVFVQIADVDANNVVALPPNVNSYDNYLQMHIRMAVVAPGKGATSLPTALWMYRFCFHYHLFGCLFISQWRVEQRAAAAPPPPHVFVQGGGQHKSAPPPPPHPSPRPLCLK